VSARSRRASWRSGHSKPDAKIKPTFTKAEAEAGAYGTRRILLLTHSRMQRGQEVAQWLQYHGAPRDLVIYDESLEQTSYWSTAYADVVAELKKASAVAWTWEVGSMLRGIMDTLDSEVEAQKVGTAPTLIKLPEKVTDKGEIRDEIEKIVMAHNLKHLDELFFHHNRGSDMRLVLAKNPAHTILIRPFTTVPIEELDRMVILDASYPIRTLPKLANANMAEDAKALRVKTFEETWRRPFEHTSNIKRYGQSDADQALRASVLH
jgi:hypothetical protein